MEERIMIAPVGENMDALFVGMRDYPVTKVILLTSKKLKNLAEKAEKDLKKFAIPVKIIEIVGNEWEGIFEKVSKITNSEKEHEVIINTSSGEFFWSLAIEGSIGFDFFGLKLNLK